MEKFWIRKTFPFVQKTLAICEFRRSPFVMNRTAENRLHPIFKLYKFYSSTYTDHNIPKFFVESMLWLHTENVRKSALKTLFPLGVKTSQRQVATNLTWQFHQVVAGLLKSCLLRRVVCRLVFLQLSEITCRKLVWQSNCNYSALTTQQTCSNLCVFWLFVSLHEFIFLVHSNKFGEVFIVWVLKTNKISEENDHMLVSLYDRVTG